VPANVTFSLSQLIWSLVAILFVFGALICRRVLINRRRRENKERPPQKSKLLRQAGYSCLCNLDEAFDQLLFALLQTIAAGAMFGLAFAPIEPVLAGLILRRFTFAQLCAVPKSYWFFVLCGAALGALIWCIRMARLTFKYEDNARNWRLGARGEQAVAESLADPKLAAAGYRAFHDVPGDGKWNIDHVVVGPGGLFVIETKACVRRKPKWEQQEHIVLFDGKALRFPWRVDHRAHGQAEANARWVREKLAPYAPKDILVQPVIVVPGWWVESQGKFPTKAMNATYLVDYLVTAKRLFAPEQLQQMNARLDELCRTVEF
jgi:hypothetical protein